MAWGSHRSAKHANHARDLSHKIAAIFGLLSLLLPISHSELRVRCDVQSRPGPVVAPNDVPTSVTEFQFSLTAGLANIPWSTGWSS